MANAIQKKLSDLHHQAQENSLIVNNVCNILKRYIDNGKTTLDDVDKGEDFFAAIAFLNAQRKAPKIEQFIRNKLGHKPREAKDNQGDGEKDGKNYEYKISTTNQHEQINALQIRLKHKIDYYLLGYIDEKQFENSRLFLLTHSDMVNECENNKELTHGQNSEMRSFRIAIKPKSKKKKELLAYFEEKYRAKDLEKIIFN